MWRNKINKPTTASQFSLITKYVTIIAIFILILSAIPFTHAVSTTIQIINQDSASEGLNSNASPFSGQTNNPGSTLGEQRLAVFQAAADYWETLIISPVIIRVAINMDPQFCTTTRATLGSAGPNSVFSDFSNRPLSNTWYVEAVANSLAGFDQDVTSNDMGATFNSDIDNNNNCLSGVNWWLGINAPAPIGTIGLFDTILHEIGHGIGVLSLVSSSGVKFLSKNDAYMYQLFDESTNTYWRDMHNAQRAASAINTNNLVWRGVNADNNSDHLTTGKTNGRIRMYAPNPYQHGSSVSHWDTSLTPDELMEPFATLTSNDLSTIQLLKDIGWAIFEGPGELSFTKSKYSVEEDRGSININVERTLANEGAVSVLVNSSDISATAGVDYTATNNQQLNWADGELGVKSIVVPIIDDGIQESGGETVQYTLSNVTGGASLGATSTSTLRIDDPDDGYLITLMALALSAIFQDSKSPPISTNIDSE